MVNISLRVLSRPVEEELPVIFKDLGENWDDRVLPSIVNEVLKAVVAQHDAHQLLTQREEVSRMIAEQLNERVAGQPSATASVALSDLGRCLSVSSRCEAISAQGAVGAYETGGRFSVAGLGPFPFRLPQGSGHFCT